jgi:integrase/recombinase XerD
MKRKAKQFLRLEFILDISGLFTTKQLKKGIIDQKYYPFGKNRYQIKAPRNIKKALTIEQINKIINYEVEEGSTQHFARDIWLFSYLCNGMNIKGYHQSQIQKSIWRYYSVRSFKNLQHNSES